MDILSALMSDPNVSDELKRLLFQKPNEARLVGRCKTCIHWKIPSDKEGFFGNMICFPIDQDTFKPMKRGFESRLCKQPNQALFEAPVQANGFALTDASQYVACMATGEEFGCVLHEENASSDQSKTL